MAASHGPSATPPVGPPLAVRFARLLLYLVAGFWLVLGFATLAEPAGLAALDGQFRWIVSAAMAANAAALAIAGWLLGLRRRSVWLFALALLAVNIALTLTDQAGFYDWVTLALDVVVVGLLIGARFWFRPEAEAP